MLYIVDDDLYDLYDLVNDIIVVAASMINDDICKIIRKNIEEAFSEVFFDTFSDLFWALFFFSFRIFKYFFYTHQSFF